MTQQELGNAVGIKFQQIQKYETGANRVSASRLWEIADSLGVHVTFFFDGLQPNPEVETSAAVPGTVPVDMGEDREAVELVRAYYAIPEHQRRRLFELARVLSEVA